MSHDNMCVYEVKEEPYSRVTEMGELSMNDPP